MIKGRTADKNGMESGSSTQVHGDEERALFVMELVALATGVPAHQIACETRNHARAARARQIAMYLSYVAWQWPLARVGRAFGRDRTTAGHACRLIEDLRDDALFDARLERLEACLQNAPEPKDVKLLSPNLLEMSGGGALEAFHHRHQAIGALR
ncbi:helix-turn-helix domain-containing protein [Asticcacaulis sp. EMRT-3]|uniref:helix-turn-helix domain-containing protein n=1 Tax=Asticcacaulis sp. EMRT-3 TaxID=3040349 RepID=UPI0024AF66D3|nr:helix-turn-helix domain-containing protein [Asticcacaulis sp. EMRT-3]MDI7775410.1 helix-turn-helix domain-containing protein [Asticcacaulis sp. EMRT-3]